MIVSFRRIDSLFSHSTNTPIQIYALIQMVNRGYFLQLQNAMYCSFFCPSLTSDILFIYSFAMHCLSLVHWSDPIRMHAITSYSNVLKQSLSEHATSSSLRIELHTLNTEQQMVSRIFAKPPS